MIHEWNRVKRAAMKNQLSQVYFIGQAYDVSFPETIFEKTG